MADNNTAKTVAELVNAKFDSTGVSATATTTVKMEMLSSDAAGDHVVGFKFYGKNSTAQAMFRNSNTWNDSCYIRFNKSKGCN